MTDITFLVRLYRKMCLITLNRRKGFQDTMLYMNIHTLISLFIHSFIPKSVFNRPSASSNASPTQTTNQYFLFQITVSSISLKIIQ